MCIENEISKMTYTEVWQQLDECENCERYYRCNKVAELNDKLVELENE